MPTKKQLARKRCVTFFDEPIEEPRAELEKTPYTGEVYTIFVGPEEKSFFVHGVILKHCPHWESKITSYNYNSRISLPELDEHSAHTILHYLYTGTYQILGIDYESEDSWKVALFRRHAFLYSFSGQYELNDLRDLARKGMEAIDCTGMKLFSFLEIVRDLYAQFPNGDDWISELVSQTIESAVRDDPAALLEPEILNLGADTPSYALLIFKILAMIHSQSLLRMAELTASEASRVHQHKCCALGQKQEEISPMEMVPSPESVPVTPVTVVSKKDKKSKEKKEKKEKGKEKKGKKHKEQSVPNMEWPASVREPSPVEVELPVSEVPSDPTWSIGSNSSVIATPPEEEPIEIVETPSAYQEATPISEPSWVEEVVPVECVPECEDEPGNWRPIIPQPVAEEPVMAYGDTITICANWRNHISNESAWPNCYACRHWVVTNARKVARNGQP